ncbi:MAG TPA: 6-phosphofructokinase [Candidatus Scybalocola faecipullorum]|nr:6-phosphofructokinase [Candidatus Scybalocola faecipullorum]
MKNILVGQSGGPTAVINGSLYGVITEGFRLRDEKIGHVYGMINGIEGFLKGNFRDMDEEFTPETLELLKTTPGAYLGSCRYKLPEDMHDEVYAHLFESFDQLNIGYFFYIGGNDSMDTVSKLSRYAKMHDHPLRVIGVPKTIDNDLTLTDHTPGFGSAAKYVACTVREIAIDASIYNTKSVTIVEIMGRNAGWLTGASALARQFHSDNPVLIYLPEVNFNEEEFLKHLEKAFEKKRNLVVCVSEGIHDAHGKFLCEYGSDVGTDTFGHKMLAGCGKYLENLVRARLGVKVRSVELNVTQRACAAQISRTDLLEAVEAGSYAVISALNGHTGQMVSFRRISETPYKMICTLKNVNDICNKEKTVPAQWISCSHADVTQEFVNYVRPLIAGSIRIPEENGLSKFIYRKELQ